MTLFAMHDTSTQEGNVSSATHHYQDLIVLFAHRFADAYRTRLVKGEDEPLYQPADGPSAWHQIIFAHGYYASALHEIAHWCIAGQARRELVDYGYWYCPDGRDEATQRRFEQQEIKPQALEWLFSVAAGFRFNVSCDALTSRCAPDRIAFQRAIHAQVIHYLAHGLPARAAQFVAALQQHYATAPITPDDFAL